MLGDQSGHDFCLELVAAVEAALENRTRRPRFCRSKDVELGADRALLGDVACLRGHVRNVIASRHELILASEYDDYTVVILLLGDSRWLEVLSTGC